MSDIITDFVNILSYVLYFAILARVIFSFFPVGSANNPLVALVYQISEPILAPLRRVIPRLGIFDLTPMVALFLLELIRRLVNDQL